VAQLREKLDAAQIQVLDTRDDHEYQAGRIPGSSLLPWYEVWTRWSEVPGDVPIAVSCATQNRTSSAVSMLLRKGYTNLYITQNGMTAWEEAGYPQETSD
jgi:rhodanese-related sulfurtransferase